MRGGQAIRSLPGDADACYNDCMALDDAVVNPCPHCRSGDRIVRAVEVCQDPHAAADPPTDLALPAYEYWSLPLLGGVGLAMLSAMVQSLVPILRGKAMVVTVALMLAAGLFGLIGIWQTWRNVARMRAVEPSVRGYHESALFCGDCGRMHFPADSLPPGFESQAAWTFFEYRRELWYACGFFKCRLLPSRG